MKTMTMEKAVGYSLNKDIVIHVPTQEMWYSLEDYVKKNNVQWLSRNCFPKYGNNTCVNLGGGYAMYGYIDWYKNNGYEIIELIPDNSLTITIQSDGHKIVSANCNDITATAKCNDTDTFNLSKGSHMALKRLIDKMNEPAKEDKSNKIGDIVEIIGNSIGARDESIGMQGIIVSNGESISVKFPVKIGLLFDEWDYLPEDLKLVKEDTNNKIEKGDIVELLPTDKTAPKEFIGLQGIVMENDSVPYVKFPIKLLDGHSTWACVKKDLKLIRKASK